MWAVLKARVYEVFPLLYSICCGQMRLMAFITYRANIMQTIDHIGVEAESPHIAPARGPPLWDDVGDAQMNDELQTEPDWNLVAHRHLTMKWISASTVDCVKRRFRPAAG
jgi:hypothetical protein